MKLSAAYYGKGNSTVVIYLYKNNILMSWLQVFSLLFLLFSAQFKIEKKKTNKKSDFHKLCCYCHVGERKHITID